MTPQPNRHRGGAVVAEQAPLPQTEAAHHVMVSVKALALQDPGTRARSPLELESSVSPVWRAAKRGLDITISMAALIVTSPVLAVIALAIKLESPGPVFFRTRRVGYRGSPLMMLKFRKMRNDAGSSPLTVKADARLTRIGAFLTSARLDELPQFWDVLRGRMSIVGPRPEDPRFVELHLADYREILSVRPGMIGLSQLAYEAEKHILRNDRPVEDYVERIMPQKLILDRLYSRRTSLRIDCGIVCWALVALIVRRPVAVNRTTGRMNVRRRRTAEVTATAPAAAQVSGSAPSGTAADAA